MLSAFLQNKPFFKKESFTKETTIFSFSTNLFLERKALPKELCSFLAQVLSRRKKVFLKEIRTYQHKSDGRGDKNCDSSGNSL